jgi:glc operon protein GlcG
MNPLNGSRHLQKMKIKLQVIVLVLTISSITTRAGEEVANRRVLTLEGAKKAGDAAAAYARTNSASPSIAVVDESGYLLYFLRPEGSFAAGANVSIGKAHTAAIFKKPTKDFEEIINKGRFTMTALTDFTPLQGGVPIVQEGQIVGAIGVSGAKTAQQDEEVARAGAAAIADSKALAKSSG